MMWGLVGLSVCATIVVAGRRHSKYLDKLDELDRKRIEAGEQARR